jgi:GT2 family glycosyltransferase
MSENASLTPQPELTVIIVSYNTRDLTVKAVQTLLDTTKRTAMHVVVIDNDSKDGSAEAIETQFPTVEVIQSGDNLGFAKANNVVAEKATTDWLLLLNPDTETHADAIDNLMDFAKAHPKAGIYGGRTVFPDGSLNPSSCWNQITPWSAFCRAVGLTTALPDSGLFNPEAIGGWKRDSIREVDIVVGCFLLTPRKLWNELGGFDLRYFMYGEEADLCLRAKKLGYQPMITPDATIMHLVGAASGTRAEKTVLVTKAKTTLIRDHWPAALIPLGIALQWLWGATRTFAAVLMGFMPGDAARARKERWQHIWSKRSDWLKGY